MSRLELGAVTAQEIPGVATLREAPFTRDVAAPCPSSTDAPAIACDAQTGSASYRFNRAETPQERPTLGVVFRDPRVDAVFPGPVREIASIEGIRVTEAAIEICVFGGGTRYSMRRELSPSPLP